jgi:hypothetical protein
LASSAAVGSADNKRDFAKTLVESWNGSTWSVVASPSAGRLTFGDELSAVSCASAAFCIAVGSYGPAEFDNSLIEAWNGSRWQVIPSPGRGPDSDAAMSAIDCLSKHECMGVGDSITPAGMQRTFAATWNGTAWTVVER